MNTIQLEPLDNLDIEEDALDIEDDDVAGDEEEITVENTDAEEE